MTKFCPSYVFRTLIFSAMLLVTVGGVRAMDVLSLTATPVRLGDDMSISLKPGEKKQVQVKVRNSSGVGTIKLESKAVDFMVADDGETPVALEKVTADDNRWSLANWLTLAPAAHTLAPEEVAVVNVLIEVPADALPGGHYAMIYHRPLNASSADDASGSGISQRVGTLLYVMVEGDVKEAAYISRFSWPSFLENGPVDFSLKVENQSDVHINTSPVVKIYNMFGKQVANLETEAKNIFPLSEREFKGSWSRVWGFGYYKAVVEASYGSQGQLATTQAILWMIPVKIILLVLIISLVLLIIVLSVKKRRTDNQETIDTMKDDEEPPMV